MSTIILRPDAVRSNPLPYAPLPHKLRRDRRLTTRAVTLAAALLEHARDQPRCAPTNRQLAADDHCSIRTVEYALANLRDAGWIAVEQGPDGRVIRLLWREAPPCNGVQAPPCNALRDPLQPAAGPPCNALRDKERSAGEERNVTGVPLPETTTASPGRPQEPRPEVPTAPRPSAPVRPLLDELKALPGAEGPKVRSLAWRLAHHLRDVASIGFFALVLGLVAQGATPLQRLLDAFRVADRARGKARKPGAIFASAWTGWQPPPLPSAIHRPTSSQAPRPPTTPPTGAPPLPRPEPSTTPPPEPEVAVEWSPELLARWERIVAHPDHPEARTARVMLAAYRAEAATRASTPSAADPDE